MNNPILYIMCGISFAGKTTLAKKLTKHIQARYISIDDLIIDYKNKINKPEEPLTNEGWEVVFKEAHSEITNSLHEGYSVIYDSSNQEKKTRDNLRKLAKESYAWTKVIYVEIPNNIANDRKEANKITLTRAQTRDDHFAHILNTMEVPDNVENVVRYSYGEDMNEWIKKFTKL